MRRLGWYLCVAAWALLFAPTGRGFSMRFLTLGRRAACEPKGPAKTLAGGARTMAIGSSWSEVTSAIRRNKELRKALEEREEEVKELRARAEASERLLRQRGEVLRDLQKELFESNAQWDRTHRGLASRLRTALEQAQVEAAIGLRDEREEAEGLRRRLQEAHDEAEGLRFAAREGERLSSELRGTLEGRQLAVEALTEAVASAEGRAGVAEARCRGLEARLLAMGGLRRAIVPCVLAVGLAAAPLQWQLRAGACAAAAVVAGGKRGMVASAAAAVVGMLLKGVLGVPGPMVMPGAQGLDVGPR